MTRANGRFDINYPLVLAIRTRLDAGDWERIEARRAAEKSPVASAEGASETSRESGQR